jgi:DNA-binding PadR family transcriptional regulator
MMRGTSAREHCPKDIELTLLEGPKNFEALVESLKDKYSRGTINKYLGELFDSGRVTRKGRKGPYELTPKGKEEAEKQMATKNVIDDIVESKKRIEFERMRLWLRDFDSDFEDFRNMLKLVADGKVSANEASLLIKWGEERLVKELQHALKQLKQIYSEMKFHYIVWWPDMMKEKVDLDKKAIDSHEWIVYIMKKILPKLKQFIESDRFKDEKMRERFFKDELSKDEFEWLIPDYEQLLKEVIPEQLARIEHKNENLT